MKKINWILLLSVAVTVLIAAVNTSVTVYSIGDSTMCNFSLSDVRRGWMQNMSQFFNSDVKIVNNAKSGRSSKSFIDEGLWSSTISHVDSGDYVIIQFGHNDEKDDVTRHTDPWTTYSDNLRKFVRETHQKGGIPILCTSIVRRYFNADGTIKYSHGEYPAAVRQLAADSGLTLIDMEELTKSMIESYGPDSSLKLFAPGDNTHLNDRGATEVADLFVEDLKTKEHPLTAYVKTTAISPEKPNIMPGEIQLNQNFPNPFNPKTTISYTIGSQNLEPLHVEISIYNMLGQKVATLVDKKQYPGNYQFEWNANGFSSGVYLYRLQAGDNIQTKKMFLMK